MSRVGSVIPNASTGAGQRLAILERSGLLDGGAEHAFDRWAAGLRRATGADVVAIALLDDEGVRIKSLLTDAGSASHPAELTLTESLESFLRGRSGGSESPGGVCAYEERPIVVDGHIVGLVSLADHTRPDWDSADRLMLEDAAAAVSTEVELRLAHNEAARAHELVAGHAKVHELIAAGAPLPDILIALVESIERHDPSVLACVLLLDRESSTLHPGAGPSLPLGYLDAIDGVVIGPNVGTCGSAAWSGDLTVTEDIGTDPKWAPIPSLDDVLASGLRHCWSMPIKSSEAEVLGTLALYGARPRLPLGEQLTVLEDSARIAGIAIERHRALDQLMRDARCDGLTGLPNRNQIFEALEDAIVGARRGTQVAVMFVDLDSLKKLNDTFGHDRADDVIRETGERLSNVVRVNDFVGRFGGDEFVVIAPGIADETEAGALGFRLLDAISQPLPGLDSTVVTASIGIALFAGANVDAREALRQADRAMYEAKRSGHDRCVFYEGSRRVQGGRRLSIARGLRDAELRGEFHLVFQPVFAVGTLEVLEVEALLRWTSPTLGEVSPAEFIPIAEDTRAIAPIGAWVLRESCETLTRIEPRLRRPLDLAVNVSAHQVSLPGFAHSVRQTLAHTHLPADRLKLEITESALLRPDSVTVRTLGELRALGTQVVLDDFGTGYSSLTWLKHHPLDAVKIDRTFICELAQNPRDKAIVSAIITMARALGCTVTAEGVETEEQLALLRDLGCERAQGFLLCRPLPLEQLLTTLDAAHGCAPSPSPSVVPPNPVANGAAGLAGETGGALAAQVKPTGAFSGPH